MWSEGILLLLTCLRLTWNSALAESLAVSPTSVGMLGGEMLDLSGSQQFSFDDIIICKFGEDIDHGFTSAGIVVSTSKARCPVPRLLVKGQVKLSVSRDQGKTYYYSTTINIEQPVIEDVLVKVDEDQWNKLSTDKITIEWKTDDKLAPQPYQILLDIYLIGYTEQNNMAMWSVIRKLAQNVPIEQGKYVVTTAEHPCITSDCTDFDIGLIEVRFHNTSLANSRRSMYSKIMPLGWYKNSFMTDNYGADWPASKCTEWYNKNKEETGWQGRSKDCPCTLQQALLDIGRWFTSDTCNINTAKDCPKHQGAVHCVVSTEQTVLNTGNECCYSKEGNLMFIEDTQWGSTPTRSNILGTLPYTHSGSVPYLSYFQSDYIPFTYCCVSSQSDTCKYYRELRKTKGCTSYNPPATAIIYGQSHYRVFNNTYVRQCGAGDFVLLKSPSTVIMGKFDENAQKTNYSVVMGQTSVILSGLAIKYQLNTLEVMIGRPKGGKPGTMLDIHLNTKQITVNDYPGHRLYLRGMTITNSPDNDNAKQWNITVVLSNGIGIQVANVDDRLFTVISVPVDLKGEIDGMLGSLNGRTNEEPNKSSVTAEPLEYYLKEQYPWATGKKTQSLFREPTTPTLQPSTCDYLKKMGKDALFCEGVFECLIDLFSTGNTLLATNTKNLAMRSEEIKLFSLPVRSCGLLDIPNSEKSNYNYTLGSSVTVTGCKVGSLSGDSTYSCTSTGAATQSWSPAISAKCSDESTSNAGMIAGVIIAVILVIVIAVIVVIVIKRRRNTGSSKMKKKTESDKPTRKDYVGVSVKDGDTVLHENKEV